MQITVIPSSVRGTVKANPSKSHAQRAIALGALAEGKTVLQDVGSSDDVAAATDVARQICRRIDRSGDILTIHGGRELSSNHWHCRESGFSLRMYTAIAGLFDTTIRLTGEGSLATRPVEFMRGPITELGGSFSSTGGSLPIEVTGPFSAGTAEVDGAFSSQFLSGLLMMLPLLKGNSQLIVRNLSSKPYIDLTLATMAGFGIEVAHSDYETFDIHGNQKYGATSLTIEGDWSGMAFFMVMGAIAGDVQIQGLDPTSTQADRMILWATQHAGALISDIGLTISASQSRLRAIEMDVRDAPDLFPPLVALCAFCQGTSVLHGVSRLTHKESNRYEALCAEFGRLGVEIRKEGDAMLVRGGQPEGGRVKAHGDHRIAMALATAALSASGPVTIEGAECVTKSYPDFFQHLADLGARVQRLA